jgi:5'-nucleotidase
MNNGGIRQDLRPGQVTYGDLFEVQPFFNNVTRVWMTGDQVRQVMEIAVRRGAPGFHISGLVVRYDTTRPAGSRVVSMRRASGGAIHPERTYVMAMSDFLQAGGDGLAMVTPLTSRRTGFTDLDALIAWLRSRPQPVVAPAGPRFIVVKP